MKNFYLHLIDLKNNKKNDEENIAQRIERETRVDIKLSDISSDIKDVKETVKTIQSDIKDHEGRIAKLEASCKRVHERIDKMN